MSDILDEPLLETENKYTEIAYNSAKKMTRLMFLCFVFFAIEIQFGSSYFLQLMIFVLMLFSLVFGLSALNNSIKSIRNQEENTFAKWYSFILGLIGGLIFVLFMIALIFSVFF